MHHKQTCPEQAKAWVLPQHTSQQNPQSMHVMTNLKEWCYFNSHRTSRDQGDKCQYLRSIKSHYNRKLVKPEKNLITKADCKEVEGFVEFFKQYHDDVLECTAR